MRSRFLADLNTTEIKACFDSGVGTALLPVGSQEMHGPHLPTGTDMIITRALLPASLLAVGAPVGYFMQDARQHACPSRHTSLRLGREVLERKVQAALPTLQAIEAYTAETADQPNQGWQRDRSKPESRLS